MSGIFTNYNRLKITSFGEELASEKRSLPTVYLHLQYTGSSKPGQSRYVVVGAGGFRL